MTRKSVIYRATASRFARGTTEACYNCQIECRRFGKHRNGLQRSRCASRAKTTEDHDRPLDSMTLPMDKAVACLKLLVEGRLARTIRSTGVRRDTILRLLALAGGKRTVKALLE